MLGCCRRDAVAISRWNRSAPSAGELGPQDLQRDPAAVLQVLGEVDCSHASPTELALDPVTLGKSSLEALQQVHDSAPWPVFLT